MNETKIENVELEKIRPSKTNPRTHFDEKPLAELTDSVRVHGILQPLVARPDWCVGKSAEEIAKVNGNAPTIGFYEIVAGERRYRAATRAKVSPLPFIVRELSDKEALEIQLIENLQRSDLDPFEEASGYRSLLDLGDHTIETIHARTGKSRSRIYDRLKLLNAPKRMREAVRGGGLSVVIAEKVGALPTKEMRDAAAAEILKPTDPQYGVGPMTVRQAFDFIETNFMRQLATAVFDTTDATLVPPIQDEQIGERLGGGSCGDCPKRTGNMPALKGTKRPDICTNPHCFALKTDAHFSRMKESALASGKKILGSEEAAKLFEDDETLWFDSPYVLMSERPDKQEVRSDLAGPLPTWAKLLEGVESRPEIVLAPTPKGRLAELVDRSLAIEAVNLAAKQKGVKSIFEKTSKAGGSTSASSSSASGGSTSAAIAASSEVGRKKREEAKVAFQVTLASMTALIAAIDAAGPAKGFWDALIEASITHAGHDGCWLICKLHGLDPKAKNKTNDLDGVQGAALEYGLTLPESEPDGHKLKLGYVVELLLSQRVKFSNAYLDGLRAVESFQAFAKLYKVDLAAVEKRVRAEAKEGKGKKSEVGGQKSEKPPGNAGEMKWTRKPEGDFKFNTHGVCEKPATLVLPFAKTTKIRVELQLALAKKGWVSGHELESGKNARGSWAPCSKSGPFFKTVREALQHEAASAFEFLKPDVAAASQVLMKYYLNELSNISIDEGRGLTVTTPPTAMVDFSKPDKRANHHFEKITDNKYRCTGCGAAAVKHEGKLLVEKAARGKPCSQTELPAKPKAKTNRAKRTVARVAKPKKGKKHPPSRPPSRGSGAAGKATARRQSRKGGAKK